MLNGINHSGMRTAQPMPYSRRRHVGHLLSQIHDYLTRIGNLPFARFCEKKVGVNIVEFRNLIGDKLKIDRTLAQLHCISHNHAGKFN